MWFDNGYYGELLEVLDKLSKGNLNFNEDNLKKFNNIKYKKITDALINVKLNLNNQIQNNLNVIDKIINGNIDEINLSFNDIGDYNKIYTRYNLLIKQLKKMNASVENFQNTIMESDNIRSRLNASEFRGIWSEHINNLNFIIDYFVQNLDEISLILNNVSQGNLSQKITVDAKGEVLELKNTINTMVDQLSQFASEVTRVAKEVGTDGLLGGQAKVSGVSGTWLDLTNNVNDMANSLTSQVRNIADVTTAVAQGDLSQKITVDAKGEVLELKNTINTMVDQLSQFASEVTRVAKEVGTDGLFGTQAKVSGVSGTWLDLTNNVNIMSESLAEVDKENKAQNWIKDGISILSKEILYKDIISEQFQIAITHLCRYINAGMGAIYIYDSISETLEIESSYAYEKTENSKNKFNLGEGVIGQVAYDRKPILIESNTSNISIRTGTTEYKIISTYTSPLIFKERLVGVVELATYKKFDKIHIDYLENAISVLAGSFYASIQNRDNEKLEYISKTDALTGLNNRGYFDKIMPEILQREKRSDSLICFAILDIDFFKNFNDTYGHQIGDQVLKSVANILINSAYRDNDLCFRIGGEEFAIIFSSIDEKKAFKFMNKIKELVEELELTNEKGEHIHNITISIGLTCKRASEIENLKTLFEETDKLLYRAKNSGRNIVIKND